VALSRLISCLSQIDLCLYAELSYQNSRGRQVCHSQTTLQHPFRTPRASGLCKTLPFNDFGRAFQFFCLVCNTTARPTSWRRGVASGKLFAASAFSLLTTNHRRVTLWDIRWSRDSLRTATPLRRYHRIWREPVHIFRGNFSSPARAQNRRQLSTNAWKKQRQPLPRCCTAPERVRCVRMLSCL